MKTSLSTLCQIVKRKKQELSDNIWREILTRTSFQYMWDTGAAPLSKSQLFHKFGRSRFYWFLFITLWQSPQQMNLHPSWCQNSSVSIDLAVQMGFLLQLLFANEEGKMLKLTFRCYSKRSKEVGVREIASPSICCYVREKNFKFYCLPVLYCTQFAFLS